MEDQCSVAMDATFDPEARSPTTKQEVNGPHSPRSGVKLSAALLVLTLCLASAAAATLLSTNGRSNEGPEQDDGSEIRHTLRQLANVRAAIHLEGEYDEELNRLRWKENVDQSHSQGDLTLRDNQILIPRSGLYFVYSQASFRVRCSVDAADDDDVTVLAKVHLSHTVQRWSRSYGFPDDSSHYQTILHSVRTACQRTLSDSPDQDGRWFSSVYMGAVFNLMEGDRLKAETERRLLPDLENEAGKTFFGVFAL